MKRYELLKFIIFISYLLVIESSILAKDDLIVVNKKVDEQTDHFIRNIFFDWENEPFNVFNQVKNKTHCAIDLGAGIGTTSIWLSKNFHHVVAIEPDVKSLVCLRKNLKASKCSNILICDRPISKTNMQVIFGPRGANLNEMSSHVKCEISNENDYHIQAMSFKQLVYDYIYSNDAINAHRISFINCNIEGGEEDILEDVLHFAYNNNCVVFMSFHLDLWRNKNITEYEYLFQHFKTNCPVENICEYLIAHPFASLVFKPLKDRGVLVKKNIPVFVIGYNQYTFIKNIVKQLEKYTSDITVIDNNSGFQPLLDYYKNEYRYTLLKQKINYGHNVYSQKFIQRLAGDLYVLTDPDLQFNPMLPDNFMEDMIDISNHYRANKVGFALLIDSDDIRTDVTFSGHTIKEWESRFWVDRLYYPAKPKLELYRAAIDTTFCLINRKFNDPSIRVAGDFTCMHIPWHQNFQKNLEKGESESYMKNNISSYWFK